jgi:opacity protein-like surface antigen
MTIHFRTSLLVCAVMAGLSAPALAADMDAPAAEMVDGWYLRADAGWSFLEWSGRDDDEPVAGLGVGYRYTDNLRTDLRVDWAGLYDRRRSTDDVAIITATGNFYFDIPTGMEVTPYLGAGAGYGWYMVDSGPDKDGFAYALMAGAEVALGERLSLDVGYRFRSILANGNDPMEHQVMIGLRYGF